eukprot:TRINITY_DN3689_c0_g1_i2.p1 TRINITY_DN3689_c0_g1~~TRINITY_DN3689_c0_g1_i2.p1  ORF type:complete len:759 (+),score=133.72 TRINITY_DN3689_c0_g1_i2:83-2278(+)
MAQYVSLPGIVVASVLLLAGVVYVRSTPGRAFGGVSTSRLSQQRKDRRQRVLLTGATGMIGSHVGRELLRRGYRVFALVRWRSSLFNMRTELPLYDLVYGDVLDQVAMRRIIADVAPHCIFHMAAQAINSEGDKNPELTLRVNVLGTLGILEGVRASGLSPMPRVFFAGSSTVYGLAAERYPLGVPEDGISLEPVSVYGVSKLCGDALMRMYHLAYKVPALTARYFIQIGAGHNHFISIQEFSRQVAMIEKGLLPPVLKHGNLKTYRDMSDVRQSANLSVDLAEKGVPGQSYNMGTGRTVSIESLLQNVVALSKTRVTLESDPSRFRLVDEAVLRANTTKLIAAIGKAPGCDTAEMAQIILDYWRAKVQDDYRQQDTRDHFEPRFPPLPPSPISTPATAAPALGSAVRVLLTGATGMIGSHVGAELLKRGYRVFALVRWRASLMGMAGQLRDYDIVYGDILDQPRLRDILMQVRPQYVYHMAAQAINSEGDRSPDLTLQVNVIGTMNLLEAIRSAGLAPMPRVLFAGSSTVYGLAAERYPQGVPEDGVALEPVSVYGVSKLTGEALMRRYHLAYRIPTITARYFIQIGSGHNHFISIQEFSRQVAMIEKGLLPPVLKHGNLKTYRDMSDVRQSASISVELAEKGTPGESYNVGSGETIEIGALIRVVASLAKKKITLQLDPSRYRNVDEAVLRANVTKLQSAVGSVPRADIQATAQTILDYWRRKVDMDYP